MNVDANGIMNVDTVKLEIPQTNIQEKPYPQEIDWKSLIPDKFLYVNNDPKRRDKLEKKYGKPYDEISPKNDNVDDADLVIMLGGLKHLLKIRGFKSVKYNIKQSTPEYASVECSITFTGNDETGGIDVEYGDNACAHLQNTTNFAQNYLVEMATNRALCRAIRSFLNINIVSKEEIQGSDAKIEDTSSKNSFDHTKKVKLLTTLMDKKGVKWSHIVDKLKKEDSQSAEGATSDATLPKKWDDTYQSVNDLPPNIILELIERLKKIPVT
jgi:hypothetical protein